MIMGPPDRGRKRAAGLTSPATGRPIGQKLPGRAVSGATRGVVVSYLAHMRFIDKRAKNAFFTRLCPICPMCPIGFGKNRPGQVPL
jgi:hypothetical protein